MEAIALRRSFENLGLQGLFAQIRVLVGTTLPSEIPDKERQALEDLGGLFKKVEDGVDLMVKRRTDGYASLTSLEDSIKAERAYRVIYPVLASDPNQAKSELAELDKIRKRILEGNHADETDSKKLHSFCRRTLAHLNRERFESFRDTQNIWP